MWRCYDSHRIPGHKTVFRVPVPDTIHKPGKVCRAPGLSCSSRAIFVPAYNTENCVVVAVWMADRTKLRDYLECRLRA